jgi:hypothetical protein
MINATSKPARNRDIDGDKRMHTSMLRPAAAAGAVVGNFLKSGLELQVFKFTPGCLQRISQWVILVRLYSCIGKKQFNRRGDHGHVMVGVNGLLTTDEGAGILRERWAGVQRHESARSTSPYAPPLAIVVGRWGSRA